MGFVGGRADYTIGYEKEIKNRGLCPSLRRISTSHPLSKVVFGISNSSFKLCSRAHEAHDAVDHAWLTARGHTELHWALISAATTVFANASNIQAILTVAHVDQLSGMTCMLLFMSVRL